MKSLGDSVFSYTKPELERSVDFFLGGLPSFREKPPPISPEVILDKIPDVKKLETMANLASQFGIEAMVLAPKFMHRDLTVVVDEEIANRRDSSHYNMAVAEEIAHIQLHRAVMLDIQCLEDFVELQAHQRWDLAERDAKYWGRALLMPRVQLERVASEVYRGVASDLGFQDAFQFSAVFTAHLASVFDIPQAEAQKRIDSYVGDLRGRLDRSIAARAYQLMTINDSVLLSSPLGRQPELTTEQLFGTANSSGSKTIWS